MSYMNKMVDNKFYNVLTKPIIKNSSQVEVVEELNVLAPFVLSEHTEESTKQYTLFMKKYHKQHKYCPKCGGEEHTTTLVGYILDWDKKEEYKDLNRSVCAKCGDKHSSHDRVSSIKII